MKKIILAAVAIISLFAACDDTTDTLGTSLTNNVDNLTISVDTFKLTSQSVKVNNVLCRSKIGYLGKVKDPETGSYVTGNFSTQFAIIEDFQFPDKKLFVDGEVVCDSIEMRLYFSTYYGDSLTTMKAMVQEMDRPLEEGVKYYSDYNPKKEGLLRQNGLSTSRSYALIDYNYSDSLRALSSWMNNIRIPLNIPYTDKSGVTYNNYGTYLLKKYYENPEKFCDMYNFTHNICPGFYISNSGGLGAMANIQLSQLNIYYRQLKDGVTKTVVSSLYGTEEVLQGTDLSNSDEIINALVADRTCTYIKSPAGIFTELSLPVNEILAGHENDTINTAKIKLPCLNSSIDGKYKLSPSSTLLMIQKDSLASFFENNRLPDYRNSYIATYSSSQNIYTFNNISQLIHNLNAAYVKGIKSEGMAWVEKHPDWNKVLLVPVTTAYSTLSQSSVLSSLTHNLSLSSVRLVGGPDNPNDPLTISVVYSKFRNQ